ncbi:MAG: ketoacyl-ACP synthase III [Armatimonadetes bacterium]|nr:ketoacyl-ACP synthase III [Armatimonadota bacterium]
MGPVGIIGSGLAVPTRVITNDDLSQTVDTSDEWIFSRTGIRERRRLDAGTDTSDLAAAAGARAIDNAGIGRDEIDTVICATITQDMSFPNTACMVQAKLGLPKGAAFDLGAACSGFVYGMVTGSSLIQTGRAKTILLVGADALSKHLDWTDRGTCVLFGDGAGAAVLRAVPEGFGLLGANLGCDGTGGPLLLRTANGREDGVPVLQMSGREVYKFAVRIQPEACEAALNEAGMTIDQIDWFIPHQANIRIIEAAVQRLGIPEEKVLLNLDRYGNTSAASIPIVLAEAVADGRLKRGDNVLLVGFGAGLTWGSAVIRWY